MKKPKLTARETVMLVILVILLVGAIYYMGFLTPLNNEVNTINAETADLETQFNSFQEKLAQMNQMKAELDKTKDLPDDQRPKLPPYDNVIEIMDDLDAYLREYSLNYNMNHSDPEPSDDGTYRRVIGVSLLCDSLDDAYNIVCDLNSSEWRCLVTYYDFYPDDGTTLESGGRVNLMLSLMFFELPPTEVPAETPAA